MVAVGTVVIAVTIVIAGMSFMKGAFSNIGGAVEEVSGQVKRQIIDELISGDKKISFTKNEIIVGKGYSSILTIGIRNKKDTQLNYKMRFTLISGPNVDTYEGGTQWFQFAQDDVFSLPPTDSDVRNVRLNIPSNVALGSYVFLLDIIDADLSPPNNMYAQKEFFVVVR